jgi:Ca-activated chloride channel family protein
MSFAAPEMLLLLLALVPVALLLRAAARRRARAAESYADAHLLLAVLRRAPAAHLRWPLILQLLALALLLFAVARPIANLLWPTNQAAVIVALDTSRSMLADDVKPSRLEAAKGLIRQFVKEAPASTQIGFLTFSNSASLLVPPTTNRQELLEALVHARPAQDTSLAAALVSGVKALPGRKDAQVPAQLLPLGSFPPNAGQPPVAPKSLPPGAILLLSDGASNSGENPLLAAKFAADYRVKVYSVPLGKEGGAVSQIGGQLYFVPFDGSALTQLSQLTGGRSVGPNDTGALRDIFRKLGTVIRWKPRNLPLSAPLVGFAALLLIVAGGLSLHWQRRVP